MTFVLPVLFVLFVWWFSTGAVIYLNNLPRYTYKWSFLGVTFVLVASIYGLTVTSQSDSISVGLSELHLRPSGLGLDAVHLLHRAHNRAAHNALPCFLQRIAALLACRRDEHVS